MFLRRVENTVGKENGKKLSKQVENTVGKGEIARYEEFLLFPQCFQKACFPEASKDVIVWEWVNPLPHIPILGSSYSAANKGMIAKIWTNRDTINCLSSKHCWKRRNCS